MLNFRRTINISCAFLRGEIIMISAIILAAGNGTRMGCKKQFMNIHGNPLISYTLEVFEESETDEIILVTAKDDINEMRKIADKHGISKLKKIVTGGAERSDSVINGLSYVNGEYVLIHDGARPFIKKDEISGAISEVKKYGAVCMGYPVKDTIKIIKQNGFVDSTPNRNFLFAAATPQCFKTELIKSAYKKTSDDRYFVTDDCMAAEHIGIKIKTLPCSYENIKITTPEDIANAESIIKRRIENENRKRL